jgi:hypothetical protein
METRMSSNQPQKQSNLSKWLLDFIIAPLIVTIIGGGLLAYFLQDARFDPTRDEPTPQVVAQATPAPASTPEPPTTTPTLSEIATTGEAVDKEFMIVNTDSNGLFLRSEPSTEGMPIETLPEGTIVEQIGAEDHFGTNFVWRYVRSPGGQKGWVAIDFLQPSP